MQRFLFVASGFCAFVGAIFIPMANVGANAYGGDVASNDLWLIACVIFFCTGAIVRAIEGKRVEDSKGMPAT